MICDENILCRYTHISDQKVMKEYLITWSVGWPVIFKSWTKLQCMHLNSALIFSDDQDLKLKNGVCKCIKLPKFIIILVTPEAILRTVEFLIWTL